MMTYGDLAPLAQTTIAIAVVWACYVWLYKKTKADYLREDLFTIRDALFDYMWMHDISYSCPAYQHMRNLLNGAIRFADELNLITTLLLMQHRDATRQSKIRTAIDMIEDTEARKHFSRTYKQVRQRLYRYIYLEGPQWIIIAPIWLLAKRLSDARRVHLDSEGHLVDRLAKLGERRSPEAYILKRRHSRASRRAA